MQTPREHWTADPEDPVSQASASANNAASTEQSRDGDTHLLALHAAALNLAADSILVLQEASVRLQRFLEAMALQCSLLGVEEEALETGIFGLLETTLECLEHHVSELQAHKPTHWSRINTAMMGQS